MIHGPADDTTIRSPFPRKELERRRQQRTGRPLAEIDPEPFYIYNSPGPMELAALFRPHIEIEDGHIQTIQMPAATFHCH